MMKTIAIVYHHEDPDGWWAESPDVPGWSATAETFGELMTLAEEGVRFALNAPAYTYSIIYDFVQGTTAVTPPAAS